MSLPIDRLEDAVDVFRLWASENPGDAEEYLPRLRKQYYAILDAYADVKETCDQARRDALFRLTAHQMEAHS